MILIFTDQAYLSLEETLDFYDEQGISREKQKEIAERILAKADTLPQNPYSGRIEEYLEHLELGHRRLIEGHCKIIYRIKDDYIYVTEIFDTRKNPKSMKG